MWEMRLMLELMPWEQRVGRWCGCALDEDMRLCADIWILCGKGEFVPIGK